MSPEPIKPGGISCQELVELVTDFLDGKLAETDVQRFTEHVKLCGPCAEYVHQVRTTTRIAAAARLEAHPDRDQLLAHFRSFRAQTET